MKKNNKGFTLVELLVAIAIASILSVIALSGVANIREHNKNKKFEAYEKAMLTGAKLYTDSYADDMFEGDSSSCYTISYNELKSKNLLQDFQENDISCSNNHTYVLVRRINDYYEYQYSLSCTNSQNQIVYSGGSKNKSSSCNGADNSAPNVIID